MNALEKLHDAVKEHEKVVLESSNDAHTDKLLQLRMSSLTCVYRVSLSGHACSQRDVWAGA